MIARRSTLADALRIAAEQYDADARVHALPPPDGVMNPLCRRRLVDCFVRQANEARKLADDIEQADKITLED